MIQWIYSKENDGIDVASWDDFLTSDDANYYGHNFTDVEVRRQAEYLHRAGMTEATRIEEEAPGYLLRLPLPRPPAHRQPARRQLRRHHGSMRAALIYQHASTERDRRIAQEMAAMVERERWTTTAGDEVHEDGAEAS